MFGNALGNFVVDSMQPKAAAPAAAPATTQNEKSPDGRLAANIFDRAAYERAIGVDLGSGGVLDAMPYEVWRARQIAQYGGGSLLNEKGVLSEFGFVGADELGIPTADGWQEKPWLGVVPESKSASGLSFGITRDQLTEIMPRAGSKAGDFLGPINDAMEKYEINTPSRQAAFLAQIAVESGQLQNTDERMNYSVKRLMEVWPSRFPTEASAAPYKAHKAKTATLTSDCRGHCLTQVLI